ncbi:hypothetical protein [Saprospira grandis]|uniref:hypothetical protein n=1 Tax=Saprospira grandis TaxID=1008 RepID=UPI0022DD1724|nr:hypothetical protein [Saprospira grandis]WBM75271.1 hypothetical protein OP864_03300 [Saprospira grandis]
MKHILEIAKIVTKKKVKKIEIFDDYSLSQKSSKFNDFYEAVVNDKFETDEQAAEYLYGSPSTDDKYRQLKSRFKKRLLNTLFFLDVNLPSASDYNRAYFSSNKDWTLIKILLSNKAYDTAAYLARQLMTTAQKFQFADVIVNCARILREHYALRDENERLYEEYDQLCKQYQNVLDAEIRSEELYQRVVINYYKPHSKNQDLAGRINVYCQALEGLADLYQSPIVHYHRYMVWAYRYEMLQDYEQMMGVCQDSEQYVAEHPEFYRDDKFAEIMIKKLSAILHMGQYTPSIAPALYKQAMSLQDTDSWFQLMEFFFLLALHGEHYEQAQQVFYEVIGDARFERLEREDQEKWNAFEIYLSYLHQFYPVLKNIEPKSSRAKRRKRFRLHKFLSDPLEFSKSERMLKVSHLIAQLLFHLEMLDVEAAQAKAEYLKEIANRRLRREEHYRTIQFIRLLYQLSKANFDFAQIGIYQKYLDRLAEEPFRYRGMIDEFEVINYSHLWTLLLERLRDLEISQASPLN